MSELLVTYRLAGRRLQDILQEHLKSEQLDLPKIVFDAHLARHVTKYLSRDEDPQVKELCRTLDELLVRTLDTYDLHDLNQEEQFQKAKVMLSYESRGLAYPIIVIHYYAGERLLKVIRDKMQDGSVNEDWYEFCVAINNQITSTLNIFAEDHIIYLGVLTRGGVEGIMQRHRHVAIPQAQLYYQVVTQEIDHFYKKSEQLIKDFQIAISEMRHHLLQPTI